MIITHGRRLANSQTAVRAAKSEIEQAIATARYNATSGELSSLYRTSVLAYTAASFWANNIQSVPFGLYDPNGNSVDPKSDLSLNKLLRSPAFAKTMWRTELTLRFWGWSLSRKRRTIVFDDLRQIDWVNPNLVNRHTSSRGGLNYFSVYPGRGQTVEIGRLYPRDAVYFTEFSFDDEFDGVSSAEVAFLEASTEPEIALTRLSAFRNLALPLLAVQPALEQLPDVDSDESAEDRIIEVQNFFRRMFKGAVNAGRTLVSYIRLEYQQFGYPHKDLVLKEQRQDIQESIAQAFQANIEFFTTGQTTFAELEGKYNIWLSRNLKPRVIRYGHVLTEQLCEVEPDYYGYTIRPELSGILREDESAKLDVIKEKQQSLIVTIGRAQELAGEKPDPALANAYLIDGVPVPQTEVANYWRYKLGQPAAPLAATSSDFWGNTGDGDKAVEPKPEPEPPPANGKKLWIGLDLADNPDLIGLQHTLQHVHPAVKWKEANSFHVTLIYAPSVTDAQIAELQTLLTDFELPKLALNVGSVNSFASPSGQWALHFMIRSNLALSELQKELVALCEQAGIALPTHSLEYKPHVTMGESPQKIYQKFKSNIKVRPAAMDLDVDEQNLISIMPGESYAGDETEPEAEEATKSATYTHVPTKVLREIELAVVRARKNRHFDPVLITPYTAAYIKGLKSFGFDDSMVIEGAKWHYVRVAAAKALSKTRSDFEPALVALFKKDITKSVFVSRMDILLERYCRQALVDGFADGGIEGIDLDDPEDVSAAAALRWLSSHITDQKQYIRGVADKLFSDESISDDEIEQNKPTMWFNKSVAPAYNYGLVDASGNALGEFKQVKDTVDTCVDCVALRGQKRRMFDWNRYFEGDLPPSSKTFCQGFNCGDMIVPASGKVSEGKLPRLHGGAKSAHLHEHEVIA